MQYIVQFLVDAPTPAAAQAARTGANQAILNAGCSIQNTSISRRQATWQVLGVVCDTGARWTWTGEADDKAEAEATALAEQPATSKVAASRQT